MTQINEAESFQNKIESHTHFNSKCISIDEINKYYGNKSKLKKIRNYFEDLNYKEEKIIIKENDKNILEKELNNLIITTDKDLDNLKLKLDNMKEIYIKERENDLNNIINNYNAYELKKKYDIESLDKEIENLNKEIKIKKETLYNELELKKKESLFKLVNEFKLKLLQYTNKKKLEKLEKEKEMEIKKKKFEADKAIEFNELNQKAMLVQKIISTIKNISLV